MTHFSLTLQNQSTAHPIMYFLEKYGTKTISVQNWPHYPQGLSNLSCIPEKCCDSFLRQTHSSRFSKVSWKCLPESLQEHLFASVASLSSAHRQVCTQMHVSGLAWKVALTFSPTGPAARMHSLSCAHLFTETGQEAEGTALQAGKAFQNLFQDLS